jgi:hypothetical protein
MSADVIIGAVLVLAALGWALAWLLVHVGTRKPAPTPPARKFYQCQQRGCTARATRLVLIVTAPTESMVVCDSDRDRLTITGRAVDLGDLYRGRA